MGVLLPNKDQNKRKLVISYPTPSFAELGVEAFVFVIFLSLYGSKSNV